MKIQEKEVNAEANGIINPIKTKNDNKINKYKYT